MGIVRTSPEYTKTQTGFASVQVWRVRLQRRAESLAECLAVLHQEAALHSTDRAWEESAECQAGPGLGPQCLHLGNGCSAASPRAQ